MRFWYFSSDLIQIWRRELFNLEWTIEHIFHSLLLFARIFVCGVTIQIQLFLKDYIFISFSKHISPKWILFFQCLYAYIQLHLIMLLCIGVQWYVCVWLQMDMYMFAVGMSFVHTYILHIAWKHYTFFECVLILCGHVKKFFIFYSVPLPRFYALIQRIICWSSPDGGIYEWAVCVH